MFKKTVLAAAPFAAYAFLAPAAVFAATDEELAQMRDEIRQIKHDYEARIRALEQRLQASEVSATPMALPTPSPAPAAAAQLPTAAAAAPASANAFNPAISAVLGGTYARLSRDPAEFRLQGFVPAGEEAGPGSRGFNLGESELTLSANVDPRFSGEAAE